MLKICCFRILLLIIISHMASISADPEKMDVDSSTASASFTSPDMENSQPDCFESPAVDPEIPTKLPSSSDGATETGDVVGSSSDVRDEAKLLSCSNQCVSPMQSCDPVSNSDKCESSELDKSDALDAEMASLKQLSDERVSSNGDDPEVCACSSSVYTEPQLASHVQRPNTPPVNDISKCSAEPDADSTSDSIASSTSQVDGDSKKSEDATDAGVKRVRRLKNVNSPSTTSATAANTEDSPRSSTSHDIDSSKDDDTIEYDDDPMLGHDFNDDGKLCDKEGRPFQYEYYRDQWRNQERYERLGEAITPKIYELLEKRCKLSKINLPLGAKDDEPHSFIFLSDDALTTPDRLLILIHGSGVVRAGQWARRLIMNDDLEKGTQIPYIERALKEGYQVMVLNTNLNYWPDGGMNSKAIPENDEPEAHAMYVWKNLIVDHVKAQHIAIVAHSYGGVVTTHLLEQETAEFTKRVFAVAFTDSVHSLGFNPPSAVCDFYAKNARNYVTSDLPVGEPVSFRFQFSQNAERVSAGHSKHEWTSYSSMESVFQYLQSKYDDRISPPRPSTPKDCTTI